MAAYYVWSGATGSANGTSWANAYTTVAAALAAHNADGDFLYVASDHLETNAGDLTLATLMGGTGVSRVISVNRAGSVPPVAADMLAGATVRTTGNIIVSGMFDGLKFVPGYANGAGTAAILQAASFLGKAFCYNCTFDLSGSSNAGSSVNPGQGAYAEFLNCQIKFAGTPTTTFNPSYGGRFLWDGNGAAILAAGSTVPASLFNTNSGSFSGVIRNTDLSGFGSNTLAGGLTGVVDLIGCKLGTGTVAPEGAIDMVGNLRLFGCDNGAAVNRNEVHGWYRGLVTENSIVRTGGANDGVTAYSWKVLDYFWLHNVAPREAIEGAIWNEAVGSPKTLTIHVVSDNITRTNDDLWLEVDYLGMSGSTLAQTATSRRVGWMTSGAALTSDSGTAWTTTGLTTPVKQLMAVTFTPQQRGLIRWRVCSALRNAAADPTAVYVCPKAELT